MHKLNLFFVLLFCQQAQAQYTRKLRVSEETPKYHIIKLNPLSPFLGAVNFHYEFKLNTHSSSQLELFYLPGNLGGLITGVKGVGITANYRYYMVGVAPSGFFVQPYFRYQFYKDDQAFNPNGSISSTGTDYLLTVYGLGAVFGYQFMLSKHITFDLFGGTIYNISFENGQRTSSRDYGPYFSGGFVRAGATIGYLF